MRMLMKVTIPVAEGNAAISDGSLGAKIGAILGDLKPEAAYFIEEHGQRTAMVVFNMAESSQIPSVAEPWFLSFNAKVELHPVMNMDDLKAGTSGLEGIVKKYKR